MKVEYTEIAGASGSTELTFRANSALDAGQLFLIFKKLRTYSGVINISSKGITELDKVMITL